jgi:hypothetical protein
MFLFTNLLILSGTLILFRSSRGQETCDTTEFNKQFEKASAGAPPIECMRYINMSHTRLHYLDSQCKWIYRRLGSIWGIDTKSIVGL